MLPPPFHQLPISAQRQLRIADGTVLFRQGDKPRAFYFVESGSIKLVRFSRSGDEVVIHRSEAGETFAEASLFSNAYHCDAIADGSVSLTVLDKEAVIQRMQTDPEFALTLTQRLAVQVQQYRRRVELLAIRSAEQRVLIAIEEGWLSKDIKSFASQIGLSHEATYRALSSLVKQGRLTKVGRANYQAI